MNRILYAITIALSLAAVPAFSQDEVREVEEVIVTALKRETSLQDTAITITAISAEDLEEKQIENFEDLQFAVPTLQFGRGDYNGSSIQLRGIGNFAVGNSTSNAIGYFWNGQTASISGLYEAELFDVERVEVLRGPQGTLFGAGTTGGVVQMISKRPDAVAGGFIKADVADYGSLRMAGAVNLPLSDRLRSRIAFTSLKRDGFVTNNYDDNKLDNRNSMAARLSLEYDFSDTTTISFIYENQQADDNRLRRARQFCKQDTFYGCSPFESGMDAVWSPGSYGHWIPYFQFQNTSLDYTIYRNNPSSDLRTVDTDFNPFHTSTLENAMLEIDTELTDSIQMNLTYSYHTRDMEDYADYDESVSVVPYAIGPVTANLFYDPTKRNMGIGQRTYSSDYSADRGTTESEWQQTELTFTSDFDGNFNFTAGIYIYETGSETNYGIAAPYMNYWGDVSSGPLCNILPASCDYGGSPFWVPFFSAMPGSVETATQMALAGQIPASAILGTGLALAGGQAIAASNATVGGPVKLAPWQSHFHSDSNLSRNTNAVYGEIYYDISDSTTLTLGARYTEFEINDAAFNSLLDVQDLGVGVYTGLKPLPVKRSYAAEDDAFKLGIDHSLNDNQMVYATFSNAFKPGGFNTNTIPGLTTFGPEISDVFEIGMKNTLMGGALQLNISAYTNDYGGLQLSKIVNRSSVNVNADAKIEGIEAEFQFFVSPTLLIDGFVSHIDATVTDFATVDPINPTASTMVLSNQLLFDPIGGTATGFLGDWAQYNPACQAGLVTGGPCILGATAAASDLLSALVLYQNTDNGIVYKSFGPLCTQPFFGLDSTTLPCPTSDGVEQDLAGNKLPGAAELNWRLGITKFVDTKSGTWSFRADISYRDDYFSDIYNRSRGYVEDVTMMDISARFTDASDTWYVGAYVRNLGDEDHVYSYYTGGVTTGGFANGPAMDPKIAGINFGMNF
tara:strand:+ start:143 stop:3022 length:2880 start_codon:yes stop_codon:yes gene_type:complete